MERVTFGAAALATIAIPTALVICMREPAREPVVIAKLLPLPVTTARHALRPPTVTETCMTPETTLVADRYVYALCGATGCFDEDSTVPTERIVTTATGVVVPASELGPRLTHAAVGGQIDATPDHSIVLVGSTPWNRDGDHPLHLPKNARGWSREGDRVIAKILGTQVLIARSWDPDVAPPPPWAPDRAYVLDAAGKVTATIAIDHELATVDLGDDSFMIPNGAGGFSLVVHGEATNFGDLATWREAASVDGDPALHRIEGQHIPLQMVRLADDPDETETALDGTELGRFREAQVAAAWCDETACHVAKISVVFHVSKHGKRTQGIGVHDRVYPLCH